MLVVCAGIVPFNATTFQAQAATTSKAPVVTAKTYSKKSGRYSVKVKQGHYVNPKNLKYASKRGII